MPLTDIYIQDICELIDKDTHAPGIDAKRYLNRVLGHVHRCIRELPRENSPARDWTPPWGVRHGEELAAQAEDARLAAAEEERYEREEDRDE